MRTPFKLRSRVREAFWRGLVALLPTVLTMAVLVIAYNLVAGHIGQPISDAIAWPFKSTGVGRAFLIDVLGWKSVDGDLQGDFPAWFGMLVAIVMVLLVGLFFTSRTGRKLWDAGEVQLSQLPVIRSVFPYAKQVTEFIFSEEGRAAFSHVVALEYPRKGIWSIGFVTGGGLKQIAVKTGAPLVSVFMPSSPTPVTGWICFADPRELIFLDMSVDEAMRMAVSLGMLVPERQEQDEAEVAKVLPDHRAPKVDEATRRKLQGALEKGLAQKPSELHKGTPS